MLLIILAAAISVSAIMGCNSRQPAESHTKEFAVKYSEGKSLFKKHCNTCHIDPELKATDQYLFENLFTRHPETYVIKFIADSKQLKSSGDKYAIALADAYNSNYEHHFRDSLSNTDLGNLIIYLKATTR